jgi:HlyD family secretion protein
MKKILIISGIGLILVVLIIVNLTRKEKGEEVEAEEVKRGTVVQMVTGSGQIQPEVEVKISANVAGKIIRLHAEEGDQVNKGQLLVELDQEQYVATLKQAESNAKSAIASEKQAQSEFARAKDLFKQGLMSDADYEAKEAAFEAAASRTEQAEAAVDEAKDRLAKTRLHSDMDGIVTLLNKEEGEMALGAQFQEDVIMIVADLSRMEAVIEIDENDVINIALDDTAAIEIDAFPDTTFKGTVTQIANSATVKARGTQEQVTNFEVTVALIDPNEQFRPGMSTTVDVFTETRDGVLKVPIQAVTAREEKKLKRKPDVEEPVEEADENDTEKKAKKMIEVVFCVEEDHAVVKPVELGISDDMYYEVKEGLVEGNQVITGPFRILSRSLTDGDLVSVKESEKEEKQP